MAMRILIATDGSPAADAAIEVVNGIEWPAGSTLWVVEATEGDAAMLAGPWTGMAGLGDSGGVQTVVETTLERAVRRLSAPGRTVESATLRGRPAAAIVEEAARIGADLIVVGSRGHGTIEAMILGSVSAETVVHANCPVLVIRGKGVDRVLLAWDGSSASADACALVRDWPIFARSTIRVASVSDRLSPWWGGFPGPGVPEAVPMFEDAVEESRARHLEQSRQMTEQLRAAGRTAEQLECEGDPASELIAAARRWPADLIVMGTHGRTGLARLILGSVARNVLLHAPCSVLITRERRQARQN